jgi:4'-phosphopantetheinyl transferase
VHVWRANLAAVSADLGELLCDEEQSRASRIMNEHDGQRWRRSRGLLRTLLGRYLQRDPGGLRFTAGGHGKPALARSTDEPSSAGGPATAEPHRVSFNMSHSGELALYAFSHTGAVGVDVEVARRPMDAVGIAARMLGPEQAQRLQALDPEVRQREFLRAWVCYEAELKCLGVGIGASSHDATRSELWTSEIELVPPAAGAVAAEHPVGELRCWDWQP